ncbi:hypothetical protein APED_27095 [Acanthopleuribacter pedis]
MLFLPPIFARLVRLQHLQPPPRENRETGAKRKSNLR